MDTNWAQDQRKVVRPWPDAAYVLVYVDSRGVIIGGVTPSTGQTALQAVFDDLSRNGIPLHTHWVGLKIRMPADGTTVCVWTRSAERSRLLTILAELITLEDLDPNANSRFNDFVHKNGKVRLIP